ncbi:MAG: alpha-N-acetylglucosaminidase C-terminal domain-containing protein [Akkermansia sp.]|nr:alpha-N-acetylglucosaminidase C-terminal domain-containing protein [Akkermansia sp.]
MNGTFTSALALACLAPIAACVSHAAPDTAASDTAAAEQLVKRMTPKLAGRVQFAIAPKLKSPVIEGKGGSVLVSAPNVRECIRGYGYYLRRVAKIHFSWNGNNTSGSSFIIPTRKIVVPEALPFNYAYNYCTLSYTSASWDKKRWERELDYMALNGVQYVLVTSGLEKVWQDFLTELDYPADKIKKFIPNPCYAAWWNMGNLEGEGGPVSQTLIDSEAELGRFIVQRLQSLGMEPVLQGYVGFLPHDFPQAGLNGKLLPQGKWCAYNRPCVLQPTAPAFPGIAKLWYKHLHAVYGTTAKAYGGDLFHEGGKKGNTVLDEAARAVQSAMQQAAPGSKWLLQAWGHNPDARLLAGTDPQHTVILALQKDLTPKAQVDFNYAGRPFVWCELSNFGGKHGMFGGMDVVENLTRDKSKAIGIGMISEGLETNPLFYELVWERMNNDKKIDRNDFLTRYARARYGSKDRRFVEALNLLAKGIYTPDKRREGSLENIMCARPGLNVRKASTWAAPDMYYKPESIEAAAKLYLAAGKKAGKSLTRLSTYRYDLADLCRQVLADRARKQLEKCKQAFDNKNTAAFRKESAAFLQMIEDCAAVLSTSEYFLMHRFVNGAMNRGTTAEDKAAMRRSLLQLITTWRPDIGVLNDYSHRQFPEMLRLYYKPRWEMFFANRISELEGKKVASEEVERGVTQNNGEKVEHVTIRNKSLEKFELGFAQSKPKLPTKPQGDILKLAEKILSKK